jgi:hypothetical protein
MSDQELMVGDRVIVPGNHVGQIEKIRYGRFLVEHRRGHRVFDRTRRWYTRDEIEPTDDPPDIMEMTS